MQDTLTTKARDLRRGDTLVGAYQGYVVTGVRNENGAAFVELTNSNRFAYTRSCTIKLPQSQSVEIVNTYGEELTA